MKKNILSVLLALCMVSGTVMSPVSMENVRAEESDITKKQVKVLNMKYGMYMMTMKKKLSEK